MKGADVAMETNQEAAAPASAGPVPGQSSRWWQVKGLIALALYLALTMFVARSSLSIQSLVLVAAVFAILAISLDLVAGMLGLYSLGQGGFFAIGAYLTTIVSNDYGVSIFVLLPCVLVATAVIGMIVGAMSLRVSGLYFAITTFIFTLVLTVLATDLRITGGTQGLLGPAFPDFPSSLSVLGSATTWCIMLGLLLCMVIVWSIRHSPLYPVLLSIRDAEPFAVAAGARTSVIKIGVFGLSAAMAGGAGWLFSFLGVVSPGQFNWAVSLNILVMVLVGGINTTIGPVIGAAFVTMFPDLVNINPWLQQMLYGALSIMAITLFPAGLVGLAKIHLPWLYGLLAVHFAAPKGIGISDERPLPTDKSASASTAAGEPSSGEAGGPIVECIDIGFSYGTGPQVLRHVNLAVTKGHIHGLIGPNGSGKSTLANVIAGRLSPRSGTTLVKGTRVDNLPPNRRASLGLRRTFQAAELVKELTTSQNVMVGLYTRVRGLERRAGLWPLLPSGRRDSAWVQAHAEEALVSVGAKDWTEARIGDVPHGIEQLTQLASVWVAAPDIIILDEPATGLSSQEVEHLAVILAELKAQGVTMIIIEHQTRFLFPLCDQVTVLNAGEVILTGTADEVRADPTVQKVYLGE